MTYSLNGNYHFRLWPTLISINEGRWPNFTIGWTAGQFILSLRINPKHKWTRFL